MTKTFDPFNDRTSRDIRNALSAALVSQLASKGLLMVKDSARQWLSKTNDGAYHAYIRRCLVIYDNVIRTVQSNRITDPGLQAVVLWNAQLFFEVHELLETVWHGTEGNERRALKGLIQAAGVFVHRQCNPPKAADGLGRRALGNLRHAAPYLGFIKDLSPLMISLKDSGAPPPMLKPGSPAED